MAFLRVLLTWPPGAAAAGGAHGCRILGAGTVVLAPGFPLPYPPRPGASASEA